MLIFLFYSFLQRVHEVSKDVLFPVISEASNIKHIWSLMSICRMYQINELRTGLLHNILRKLWINLILKKDTLEGPHMEDWKRERWLSRVFCKSHWQFSKYLLHQDLEENSIQKHSSYRCRIVAEEIVCPSRGQHSGLFQAKLLREVQISHTETELHYPQSHINLSISQGCPKPSADLFLSTMENGVQCAHNADVI